MAISDDVLRHAVFAADAAAMQPHNTEMSRTRAIVKAALECLEGNGIIQVTPQEDWPEWIAVDPPYIPFERR